jgi:predicted phosphohydrolase
MGLMSRLFAIGDLHLSFASEKPMGVFGANWDDHHVKIEKNWRSEIAAGDTVFLLGDLSWGLKFEESVADLAWIHGLPGRKVLLKGNHDLWWQSVTRLRALYDDMFFLQNDSMAVGEGAASGSVETPGGGAVVADDAAPDGGVILCGSRGWVTPQEPSFDETEDRRVYERELIRLRLSLEDATRRKGEGAARLICGLHYSPSARPDIRSGFMELFEEFGVEQVLYGHLHGREAFKKGVKGVHGGVNYRLVSADYLDFKPLRIV